MLSYSKIIICLWFFCSVFIGFGQENSNFIKLSRPFSQRSQIVEDHFGFIQIANASGIYKYNGYDFYLTSFKTIFGETFTRDKDILFAKDYNDNLWIASFKGELTKIAPNGEKISYKDFLKSSEGQAQITAIKPYNNNVWFGSANGVIYEYDNDTQKINSKVTLPKTNTVNQQITTIALSDPDNLWLSTLYGTIYTYNLSTKSLRPFTPTFNKIKLQNIHLANDNFGRIWFATELEGLHCYNPKDKTFKKYDDTSNVNIATKHHQFISIFCDKSGTIWAGTDGDGLYSINTVHDDVTIFKHQDDNRFSLSSNTIIQISEDSKNNIWIIGKKGIVNIFPKGSNKIKHYSEVFNNTHVLSILKAQDGSLYIGSDGKGLNRVLPNGANQYFGANVHGKNTFGARYIQNLAEDEKGNIWIATYQNGLWIYNPRLNSFKKLNTSSSEDIRTLFRDSKGRIWMASTNMIGIFDDNQKLLAGFDFKSNGLFGTTSMSITEDENRIIWLGVNPNELYKFNENFTELNKSVFTKHKYFLETPDDIKNYNIISLRPDYNGHLWILCTNGILIKYNLKTQTFESFSEKIPLKEYFINSFLIENPNSFWLSSSNNGILHYNLVDNSIKSYHLIDGIRNGIFTMRSAFKDENGTLYFGGDNGIDSFTPQEMVNTDTNAKLFIDEIEILNKPANLIIPDQLDKGVENIRELKLNYNQSSFSFQFAAIDNLINPNYYYAFKLDGFDENWILARADRIATYTNIPYGNYTFKVKAGTKQEEWNIAPISIKLSIRPPWYYSNLAFLLYLVIGVLVVYTIVTWLRLKSKLAKETWENNKEKELYALKMNFFAKMSHEIQTPLTLILGPISDMLKRASDSGNELLKQRLLMINNNANRLSRIAMELMTVRNKELGRLRIYASKNNLIADLKKISQSFNEQARFKNIDFIQIYPNNDLFVWYDKDKIEHILYNLLSNAFKFTPNEGQIELKVALDTDNDYAEISVQDSGPGIPEHELEDIFKLFYQSDLGKHSKGTGIGLALTKDLIELHKGKISVTSSPKAGTCFSVMLSTKENIFTDDEKLIVDDSTEIASSTEQEFSFTDSKLTLNNIKPDKKYNLLIVEDNIEMQMFLKDVLESSYDLLIASNGKEGVDLAKKHMPDLIISDIMMPIMDGIELCNKLQKNRSTNHIPIILLTAKNTSDTKIRGLNAGAIEYLKKPFNFYELLLRINNILSSKEKILFKYKADLISSPDDISEPSKDHVFLENLVKEVNNQLENPDFKLEDLTKTFNMSYSVIYRKYQEITGKTLIELVKSLRLKKAALLILKNGYNISEAAYIVGYKDAKYFTKSFKEEFGIPPATFKRESKILEVEKMLIKYKIGSN